MRQLCGKVIMALVGALTAAGPARSEECSLSAEQIFARASPSIVQIFSLSIDPFLVLDRVQPSFGTGFQLGDGYVLTNYHVVADTQKTVAYFDEFAMPVQVVGIDPALDVAVLWTVQPGTPLEFGKSGDLAIGQQAFVIGFPLGLGKTISAGIVSGVSRVLPTTTSSWLAPYIQTDAAVSPGNSGGPLLDACGRVIGMITSSISDFGAENIGFAIPSDVLEPVAAELIESGHVSRPWHGLYGQITTPQIMQILGMPLTEWYGESMGFLVETIEPGSPADRAGLLGGNWPVRWGGTEVLIGGDIITYVDGQRIDSMDVALGIVGALEIGDVVELTVLRDGREITKTIEIEERPILEGEMDLFRRGARR